MNKIAGKIASTSFIQKKLRIILMINIMNIKFLTQPFKVSIYFLCFFWCLSFLIKTCEIETAHIVMSDDIGRSKINFGMISGILFKVPSLLIWKTVSSGLSLKQVLHDTSTFAPSVLHETSYLLTCLTMLSPNINTRFVFDCFRTFSLILLKPY